MLSERQLEALLMVFQNRMQEVTNDYLRMMGAHLRDIGELTPSDLHRLKEMKRVGANVKKIKQKIARAANISMEDLERVLLAAAESNMQFAEQWFATGYTAKVKGRAKMSTHLERILKAQMRATAQTMQNLSKSTVLSSTYQGAVDAAVQVAQSGIADYNSAIRNALKRAAGDGLRVQYESGHTRRLDSAMRQNILDGVRELNRDMLEQLGKEYGADGVELSAHYLCAEDHLPYQGRQFSMKEFERIQNSLDRPFGMWNCKHTIFPIIMGVSVSANSEEELAEYRRNSAEQITIDGVTKSRYEWTQEQRRIETAVRQQKDIGVAAQASGDMALRREAQANINKLMNHYDRISEQAGLHTQYDRTRVAGYRSVKAAEELKTRSEYDTILSYQEMLSARTVLQKTDKMRGLPLKSKANSISDFLSEDGNTVLQRRVYDRYGRANVDFDTTDHKRPKLHPTGAHKHLYDYKLKNPRSAWKHLSDYDLDHNKDIIQKGVNYRDAT